METPVIEVLEEGHVYSLANIGRSLEVGKNDRQTLTFFRGPITSDDQMAGTTNEAVLMALTHRLEHLYSVLPDDFTYSAITAVKEALAALEARTKDRKERGVEGQNVA